MTFEQVPWSETAGQALRNAAGSPAVLRQAKADIRAGRAQLWQHRTPGHQRPYTYVVTRVERDESGGRELVVWLGEGTHTRTVIKWATALAKANGMTARAHITDNRLCRIFQRLGWHETERVVCYGR